MEVDYIDDYNGLQENIVRLYNFDKAEAIKFRDLLKETVVDKRQKLDVSQVDFIDTEDCNLIFGLFKTDEGILTKDNETFFCILTIESYRKMIRLLEPFCNKETKGHQYLYDVDTPTDLLFAPGAS
jgi:hypothetical protein